MKTERFTSQSLRRKETLCLLLLTGLVLVFCLLQLVLGPSSLSLQDLFAGSSSARAIFWHIRLPRMLAALVCGSALAVSGGILQKVLANPLASPGMMGINAGAGLLVTVCGILFPGVWQLTQPAAFLGAMASSFLMLGLLRVFQASRLTIVLAGLGLSQILSGFIDLLVTLVPEALLSYSDFRIGSLNGVQLSRTAGAAAWILPGLLLALLFSRQLELLSLGRQQARSLGLQVSFWTPVLLTLSSLLCGAAISLCGLLGFVGLVVPQITGRLPHSSCFSWLLMTILTGAALLLCADLLSRILIVPFDLPCGILLSLTGGPYFLWLLLHPGWRKKA